MDARGAEIVDRTPASRKLGRSDAEALLADAETLYVAKGRKQAEVQASDPGAADMMLGPTGNLRAPVVRVGRTLIVGYHEEALNQALG
ncbi:MAG: hypothetical protein OXH70_17065 [Acidobacteria bacterium]|nr:hypothetical protein [Acidobacteriota bacterium]MDE2976700.1 hypothetical protein [Acidobacteriota bacterium]